MFWLYSLLFGLSLVLQVILLNTLRRGVYKQYGFVFAYSIVLFLTTIADGVLQFRLIAVTRAVRETVFYQNDAVRQFLLFAVVISLIDTALRDKPIRSRVRLLLIAVGICVTFVSFQIHSLNDVATSDRSRFVLLMTSVLRDLNFVSMGLTFLLWLMLIAARTKDLNLLTIAGGLGLQFAGDGIGQSLRYLSRDHYSILVIGNLIAAGTHLLRLFIWYKAFTRLAAKEKEPVGEVARGIPQSGSA